MKKQIPLTPVLAVGLLIVAAVVWFALIGPKSAKGAQLAEEKADLESKIALARHPQGDADTPAPVQIDVADLFRLAKAMPPGSFTAAWRRCRRRDGSASSSRAEASSSTTSLSPRA